MRCILGLATAGLVLLGGTAAADAQPPRHPSDLSAAGPVVDPPPWPPRPEPAFTPRPRPTLEPPDPDLPWVRPIPPRPTLPPGPPWGKPIPPRPIPIPPRPPIGDPPWGPTIDGPRAKRLTLTVSWQGRVRTIRLGCNPVYGTHPYAAQACALLGRAQGNPAYIRLPWVGCPRQYDPVTVSATGTWNGRPVRYRRTFTNQCEVRAATGAVFST
ncbi:SSI family serine proteinase inhibitor [Streptosporangium sp. NPDC048865]|uniref:SSI family serine proteinase inhibitor n=1 Tax=Streptosporangium sp. NPDC048865 TaxID=3155766 RepID=UPI0034240E51